MTNEQAKKMLKAKLECLKHETSGMYSDCNRCNCDECSLNYEQGNMGEQKEALDMTIKALEQQPCEDAISREYLVEHIKACWTNGRPMYSPDLSELLSWIDDVPLAQPKPIECDDAISRADAVRVASGYCHPQNIANELAKLPSVNPQPKTGRWVQISPQGIYECSECGQNVMTSDICAYKFCHGCGAKMVEPQESEDRND